MSDREGIPPDPTPRLPGRVYEGVGRILVESADVGFENCAIFGYADLSRAGLDDFPFLHDTVLDAGETLMLPMVQLPGAAPADIFMHGGLDGLWLLFVGRSSEHSEQLASQQRLNDAVLQGHGYGRLLDRFVGGELLKHRLLESPLPTSLGPTTRHLTMLFADIRGFTAFCEERDAAEACQILNRYLESMVTAVADHGGTIGRIIGDAVMALFGLTDASTDAAARAVQAAQAMVDTARELSDSTRGGGTGVCGVGVGMATGKVAAGVLGTSRRRSFTVIGHRVNLAARLESSAEPGEILIDEATHAAAGEVVGAFTRQTRLLKGLAEPVTVYSQR